MALTTVETETSTRKEGIESRLGLTLRKVNLR